ncbi:2Fe-2S iron-sulfur cluster-binding protein [Comamonas endophytica]|uniref:2Fe-2S iron-sulfur cluster binding domain-containing protein n=1 Tax=Comamonas endophytica TaxID=2949090 RepID=A0ABY6GBR5_9BURK|nr:MULTISPECIES: 2Fe-2S iron-sulfur cluster binding domain-containing protein [unclassified Acidovorax]MCD2513680.1 2Fe-2S iron-sulfur cluster binding domain-containing protein [Acidovorax sp. D4N7]UYG52313.1 2Fe-2S iron-sulfur cluster binding domain-containing protein [Acidovorax sp. 5MLIR]
MQISASTAAPPATEAAFELVLARSQLRLNVEPGESMADVLQLAGIAIDTLCEQGVCGTCATRWLEGAPAHRDSCLSAEEQRTHVAVCCARSHGASLTLDL